MFDQTNEANYYRIGLFVMLGFVLLVGFIMMVVGSDWLHQSVHVESYFDESVQGLSVGSPVKYRGVTVGQVKKIGFIGDVYQRDMAAAEGAMSRYVYVQMAFRNMLFLGGMLDGLEAKLDDAITHGLRMHLAPEGLTGNTYLDLDFVPEDHTSLAISWHPKTHYIPSRRSTMSTVVSSLSGFFSGLKGIDFTSIFDNASHAANSLKESLDHINHVLMVHQGNIDRTIDNVSHLTQDLRLILESMSVSPRGFLGTQSLMTEGG